jgi:hypothetical protein
MLESFYLASLPPGREPFRSSLFAQQGAEIDIAAADAFNQATVTTANVTLTQTGQGSNVPVPVRFVFSQGGTKLAVFPLTALQPSTTYTVAASGLANGVGGLIAVPTVSFTTQANTPPNFNTDAIVFGMPDQNGNVAIYIVQCQYQLLSPGGPLPFPRHTTPGRTVSDRGRYFDQWCEPL